MMCRFRETLIYSVWAALPAFFEGGQDGRVQASLQKRARALPNEKTQCFLKSYNQCFLRALEQTALSAGKAACVIVALALSVVFYMAQSAKAGPEMPGSSAADRFAAMDANADGKVSREAFFSAYPAMKDEAFAAIDADGDGVLDIKEWTDFTAGHGMGRMPPLMPPMPPNESGGASGMGEGRSGASSPPPMLPLPPLDSP
jgi:hypothetical protein